MGTWEVVHVGGGAVIWQLIVTCVFIVCASSIKYSSGVTILTSELTSRSRARDLSSELPVQNPGPEPHIMHSCSAFVPFRSVPHSV